MMSVYKSPWFVVFDPYLDAVVICIRGTKSMKDTVTSMRRRIYCSRIDYQVWFLFGTEVTLIQADSQQCWPIKWDEKRCPESKGMYTSARNILEILQDTYILDTLFNGYPPLIALPQFILDSVRLLSYDHIDISFDSAPYYWTFTRRWNCTYSFISPSTEISKLLYILCTPWTDDSEGKRNRWWSSSMCDNWKWHCTSHVLSISYSVLLCGNLTVFTS